MQKKGYSLVGLMAVLALLLAACGGGQAVPEATMPAAVEPMATDVASELPEIAATASDMATMAAETAVPVTSGGQAQATAPAAATGTGAAPAPAGFGETLAAVQARGNLVCGINGQLPGFSYLDPQGNYAGFDVDYCRAIAAAVLGDPNAVEFRATTTQERFTVLQTGEVDVLVRNTTWSLVRDTELGLNFTGVTFYDGQGIMVPADSGITDLAGLEGGTICVQKGTTTELNLADVMATNGINYTPAVFDDVNATYGAYSEGRCDAVTSDKSQLSSVAKGVLSEPDAHMIMDVTLSKEPLGPAVRHGDDQWFDIVRWVGFALVGAEEYGLTSENIGAAASDENPEVRRFIGAEGDLGLKLGLENDWAVRVIEAVGNYEEVYNRNLGEGTPTFIPRGLNSLYTDGGVLYAPPFR